MASSLKFTQRKLLLNRINHVHERAIRLVYKDYTSSFDESLFKHDSFGIYHRNLQKLATEIFKVKLGIAPDIMKNVFPIIENPYDLRNETKFKFRNVITVRYDIKLLLLLHQEFGAPFQEVSKNFYLFHFFIFIFTKYRYFKILSTKFRRLEKGLSNLITKNLQKEKRYSIIYVYIRIYVHTKNVCINAYSLYTHTYAYKIYKHRNIKLI